MQFKATVIALFASLAAAQDLSLIPSCALPCFVENIPVSGCTSVDFACLCGSDAYNEAVLTCAVGACSEADQAATLEWAIATCDAAGVPINP